MKLLFICTHNRCRSILAEAITNHIAGDKIQAVSAGSTPEGEVHPLSLKFLAEHKIATSGLRSKSWDQFEHFKPNAVLTLCDSAAQEACPTWFGDTVQVHWGLEDPSKVSIDESLQRNAFNTTIDILERRVKRVIEQNLTSLSANEMREQLQKIGNEVH